MSSIWNPGAALPNDLRSDLASFVPGKGSGLVGYTYDDLSIGRTVQSKLRETVSVLDFGADPTGVADSTDAFNAATRYTVVHGGNDDLSMRREILVPAGDYLISGTVYVRKGQMLRGAGDGVSRIVIPVTASGTIAFKLGYGLIAGIPTEDAGGLAVVMCYLHTFGGDGAGTVISATVPGQKVHDMFITSAGNGIVANGGDGLFYNIIFDGGLNGMFIQGQNQIVSNCLFYLMNYGVTFGSGNYDNQLVGCHFEYSQYNDILFGDGIINIQNVSITNCQFVKNIQYATSNAAINFRCNSADVTIHGCEFRNQRGYSIAHTTGVSCTVRVSDCVFKGLKSNPVYTQSTTAAGIDASNAIMDITNCSFENLFGNPIFVNSVVYVELTIRGCKYKSISTATSFVTITGIGSLRISNCEGDNVLPIINTQSSMDVSLKGNRRWLGAPGNAGGRFFWRIPTQGGAMVNCGITANTNPGANAIYRKASSIFVGRHVDYDGANFTDYVIATIVAETPTGTVGAAIDCDVDLVAVGSGATAVYVSSGRDIIVSVPNTYGAVILEADFVTA